MKSIRTFLFLCLVGSFCVVTTAVAQDVAATGEPTQALGIHDQLKNEGKRLTELLTKEAILKTYRTAGSYENSYLINEDRSVVKKAIQILSHYGFASYVKSDGWMEATSKLFPNQDYLMEVFGRGDGFLVLVSFDQAHRTQYRNQLASTTDFGRGEVANSLGMDTEESSSKITRLAAKLKNLNNK